MTSSDLKNTDPANWRPETQLVHGGTNSLLDIAEARQAGVLPIPCSASRTGPPSSPGSRRSPRLPPTWRPSCGTISGRPTRRRSRPRSFWRFASRAPGCSSSTCGARSNSRASASRARSTCPWTRSMPAGTRSPTEWISSSCAAPECGPPSRQSRSRGPDAGRGFSTAGCRPGAGLGCRFARGASACPSIARSS